MSMLELASPEEFYKVEKSLQEAVEESLRSLNGQWTDNEAFAIRNRMIQMQENVLHKLRLGIDCSGVSDQIVNKNGELVLYSGDSYNKLHEDEIGELEEKATRLATELEECRQKVPAQIVEKLHNHLRTLRPSTDIGDATGIKENHTEDSEDVDGLKIKLSTTSRKLPEVRAKIEEAVARTERVIEAIEEQASKSDADFSIEKLLEETAEEDEDEVQDEDDASESKISPELKKAEIAGHVSVRKKWVNMMSCPSPLKFSLKDAR